MTTVPPTDDQEADSPPPRVTGRASVGGGSAGLGGRGASNGSVYAGYPSSTTRSGGSRTAGTPYPADPRYATKKKRLRPRWGRIALVAALALVLIAGIAVVSGWLYANHINDKFKRTDAFASLTGRPAKVADGAVNILLLGSDSRDPDAVVDSAGQWRTDTIAILHMPASHDKAYLVSLPRDLYVYVPKSKTSQYGGYMAKINAAYAWGGIPLMVQTVEGYTGVHLDHVMLIDFGGFEKVVDALGGVDLNIEQTITSIHPPYRTFKKGLNHLNGAEALDYVRQRKQFPDGDFARIRHQQQFLKALMDKAVSSGTVTDLPKLNAFLSSVADAITVDKDFSLLDMIWQFHSLDSSKFTFLTSPNTGSDTIDGESVVVSDKAKATAMYDAITRDTLAAWLAANPVSHK
jgi:LCP family protein required for cell wall assembly